MPEKKKKITRRDLFKMSVTAGAAMTVSSVPMAANLVQAQDAPPEEMDSDKTLPQVPRRVLTVMMPETA